MLAEIVSAAFFVGAASSVMGGLDVLLSPEQRKCLDDALETLTLWFHYQRPLQWMLGASESGRGPALLAIVTLSCGLGVLSALRANATSPRQFTIIVVLSGGVACLQVALGRWAIKFCRRRPKRFFIKWGIIALLTGVVALMLDILWRSGVRITGMGLAFLICLAVPWLVLFFVFSGLYCVVFCLATEAVLLVFRALSWRIVRFSTGPTKGLVALATVVLGIAKLMLG